MRNLSLVSSVSLSLPASGIKNTTFDLDENVTYLAAQKNVDGEAEVEVWKLESVETTTNPELVSTFKTPWIEGGNQLALFRFIAETRQLVAISRGGDVITIAGEDGDFAVDDVGSFESGILAAAWNPDESCVAILTGERKLILLSTTFDVLSEKPLETAEFGEDAPINVGWGSKQTQFHGSLGKTAAQAQPLSKVGTSPDDDQLPRISWRGDGAFFVVSSISQLGSGTPHRRLRVYNRSGDLQSTSEDVPGLEHTLDWRPSGNLITGTQRFGFEGGGAGKEGRHDIVFFERNGLRHGEFSLRVDEIRTKSASQTFRWGYRIGQVSWNSDSTILAIWINGEKSDLVQLWTTGNYHWYLKQEITTSSPAGRFSGIFWHPEKASQLVLTTENDVTQRTYAWDTWVSLSQPPNDSATVAVVDGSALLLTPFRSQNVPPPMSSFQLPLKSGLENQAPVRAPIHATFSVEHDAIAVLWEGGSVELWSLNTKLTPGPGKVMNPVKLWQGPIGTGNSWRQISLVVDERQTYVLATMGLGLQGNDQVSVVSIKDGVVQKSKTSLLPRRGSRWILTPTSNVYSGSDGTIFCFDLEKGETPIASFPEFCFHVYQTAVLHTDFYVGLGKTGKVYVVSRDQEARTLVTNANSLALTSGFIIFATTAHEAVFVPLSSLPSILEKSEEGMKELQGTWESRKVERGSRIVVPVPSSTGLVLQMPRGNLETIYPRPMVMEVVNQDVDDGNYRKAFYACRKHRIDLNAIVDRNRDRFITHIPQFIDQVHEVDHLNLFLTLVGRGSQSPDLVSQLCDAFRIELEKKDLAKYVNTILTTHVVKTPPDHEAGLALIQKLKDTDEKLVEEAVRYITFLVDANKLYDTALGMYDFSLVVMIAQQAQKDPREYLPFLRDLRALDKYYQRFKIDDHLNRHKKALKNLSLAGPEIFEEAVTYLEKHRLYEDALQIWKDTEHYEEILDTYGDYLFERREFRQAASVFTQAKRNTKAMIAFEKALLWQELFEMATLDNMDDEDVVSMAYRVSEELVSKKRHSDAARVLLDYAKDAREAVVALSQGNLFSEARRITSLHSVPGLLEEIIYPAALDSRTQIAEDIGEMQEQLRKQISRLRELRVKKEEEPDAFYGTEDNVALHNVDVMTDVSMAPTAFTRYTAAPTSASRSSWRTSRSKRKMERKVGSGRKGTVDEEEYLLRSITKLSERFRTTQGEGRALLPHLYQFSDEHREEGRELQAEIATFEAELKEAVEEVWKLQKAVDESEDGWAARMAEIERVRKIDPLDKVPKPNLDQEKGWSVNLFDMS